MKPTSPSLSRENVHPDRRYGRVEAQTYALLRAAFGLILFTHGLPKALHISHGAMNDPMAASIHLIQHVLGLPFAPQIAYLVMLLETAGALALAVGFHTRIVALLFCAEMIGICFSLGPTWPWLDRGIEYPVLMGMLALYVASHGGGPYSVDGRFWRTSELERP
ncbi:DoxX family protein [Burkholderia sp. 22PA0099]|uniref:DoxX family protein n=1 Tax=Burkholderia sp. 22PA0099 TaxID=3237372 RepID=UPI0039C05EBB